MRHVRRYTLLLVLSEKARRQEVQKVVGKEQLRRKQQRRVCEGELPQQRCTRKAAQA
jgi:hypothetical protein